MSRVCRVAGKRVVIFRGEGGRELLGDTLRERGATVDYVACYRRARPKRDTQPLLRAWDNGEIDAVTVSSSEGVRNLFAMLGERGQRWLKRTPVFAPHARIAANARALGCERVTETAPGRRRHRRGVGGVLGENPVAASLWPHELPFRFPRSQRP